MKNIFTPPNFIYFDRNICGKSNASRTIKEGKGVKKWKKLFSQSSALQSLIWEQPHFRAPLGLFSRSPLLFLRSFPGPKHNGAFCNRSITLSFLPPNISNSLFDVTCPFSFTVTPMFVRFCRCSVLKTHWTSLIFISFSFLKSVHVFSSSHFFFFLEFPSDHQRIWQLQP